ncbi:MAG TPA: substrate-binding domain-containing protein [Jatrophihabitans sp.]
MSKIQKMLAVSGVVAATTLGVASATAVADPPHGVRPGHISIVGTGSDTTQLVVDAFSTAYNKTNPAIKMYSFDAVGTATITEKTGCTPRTRPNGSSAGIAELEANLRPAGDTSDHCVDFARSSRARTAGTDPSSILFIPFAIDAVTWSADTFSGSTHATANLSTVQLNAIYSCDASILNSHLSGPVTWKEVGGTSTHAVIPVIPQSSSGTRKFFLTEIGVATPGSCVKGLDDSVEENEGTNAIFKNSTTAPDIIFPYSVAVYLAQSQGGHGTGTQGKQVLRNVNHVAPTTGTAPHKVINSTFPYLREVYNVVRNLSNNGGQTVPKFLRPLFGNGSPGTGWICKSTTAKSLIQSYGFLPTNRCGSTE